MKIDWEYIAESIFIGLFLLFNPVSIVTLGIMIGCYQAATHGK